MSKHNKTSKFIRHRDIKMKDKEIKYERKIQVLMCQGICTKCVDILKWKFHYDKYKPLRHPAKCQDCKNKVVTKAYRTLCDKCAINKQVCPGCCEDFLGNNRKIDNNTDKLNDEMDIVARIEKSSEMNELTDLNDIDDKIDLENDEYDEKFNDIDSSDELEN